MSKFFTAINVDIEAVAGLLPEGAFVESVRWNPREERVEIVWDHPPFDTGKDFAVEFGAEDLKKKRLPKGVGKRKTNHGSALAGRPVAATQVAVGTPAAKAVASVSVAELKPVP